MAQIFHPLANTLSKASLALAAVSATAGLWILGTVQRSSWNTLTGVAREQTVPFSHAHHVGDDGIDCRYCHEGVERSPFAGIPSTEVCMSCHSQIWKDSPTLAPVRESLATGRPMRWTRVHDLPDFVFFDHSVHVAKGVGCSTCHGRVDRMPLVSKQASLQMEWCVACHRDPSGSIRPRDKVFDDDWRPDENRGPTAADAQLEDCSVCHR